MTTNNRDERIASEVAAAREEYADEEAEAAEMEIAEKNAALTIPLNLRIDAPLDRQFKQHAAAAEIPTSALVRRLLREALKTSEDSGMTVEQVEAIARRVLAEARQENPKAHPSADKLADSTARIHSTDSMETPNRS